MTETTNAICDQDRVELIKSVSELYGLLLTDNKNVSFKSTKRFFALLSCDGEKYLCKEWPSYRKNENQVAECLHIMDIAEKGGVPLSPFLPTKQGERSFLWKKKRLSLQKFVGERTCDITNLEQVQEFAKTLGKFHKAVWNHNLKGESWDLISMSFNYLNYLEETVNKRPSSQKQQKIILEIVNGLKKDLIFAENIMEQLGWNQLSLISAHGDYHHHNVRYSGNKLVAIVDFDQARPEPRLYDIAYAFGHLYGTYWPSENDSSGFWTKAGILSEDDLKNWVKAYSTFGPPLTPQEEELLPLVCAAVWPRIIETKIPQTDEELEGCESVLNYMSHLLRPYRN